MPRNRHLPGWRFLRFITIVTVYDPICNVIRIGLTSLPGGVANRLPLLQRHCQITTFFDAAQYRPPRDGAAFFLLFLWFAAAGAGRFAPPRKGAASRKPSPWRVPRRPKKKDHPHLSPRKAGKSHETVQLWGENGKKYPVSQQTQRVFSAIIKKTIPERGAIRWPTRCARSTR